MSLEEIESILHDNPTTEKVRDMLNAQLAVAESTINEAQRRRERIVTRLYSLEMDEASSSHEISLKSVDMFTVAAVRETMPKVEHISQRWNEIFTMIAE